MAGRAPFRAQRRFPPKGTYCWLSGKLSVFRSCLRCFSLKMEWTIFKKSFLLSGELQDIKKGFHFVSVPNSRIFHHQQNLASTWIDPYLQHSWNVLSGRPSDSDFVWTISHTAEVSQSEEENNPDMICVILVTRQCVQTCRVSILSPVQNIVSDSSTCVCQGPDLEGISWNHVTESEGVLIFWR